MKRLGTLVVLSIFGLFINSAAIGLAGGHHGSNHSGPSTASSHRNTMNLGGTSNSGPSTASSHRNTMNLGGTSNSGPSTAGSHRNTRNLGGASHDDHDHGHCGNCGQNHCGQNRCGQGHYVHNSCSWDHCGHEHHGNGDCGNSMGHDGTKPVREYPGGVAPGMGPVGTPENPGKLPPRTVTHPILETGSTFAGTRKFQGILGRTAGAGSRGNGSQSGRPPARRSRARFRPWARASEVSPAPSATTWAAEWAPL